MPIWTRKPARTLPRAARNYWHASMNPPKPQPHSCCRCIDATTTAAGPAQIGDFVAAASYWWTATRRQAFGWRSTRSAGRRRARRAFGLPLNAISGKPPRPRFDTDPTTVGDELHPSTEAAEVDDDETAPTTAMVAEVRDGLLYVFMPPTEALDHFVDLIGRVHDAAAKTGCPVVIEGYDPPPDPRLTSTTITPDPGVIEVNIAPTASFAEQSRQLDTLYEEARL